MFDIGLPELLVILGVALIVLGPKRLPELARSLGKTLAELRRTSDELRREVLYGSTLEEPPPSIKKPSVFSPDPKERTPSTTRTDPHPQEGPQEQTDSLSTASSAPSSSPPHQTEGLNG